MSILDPEAAQLLRRAIQLGDPGRTTIADLRRALDHPVPFELPPSRLRGDAPLAKVLRRAMELAEDRGVERVRLNDLLEAMIEAEAVTTGLDLDRLRFARFRVTRDYGETPPGLRQLGAGVTSPRDGGGA